MTENTFPSLTIKALPDVPLIQEGDNLTEIILEALKNANETLEDHDILVISSKIISKSEGRLVKLADVTPSEEAIQLAEETRKDPRVVELALRESTGISRKAPGVMVTIHNQGFVSANAGIDQSNISQQEESVLLLPLDPDKSAQHLRENLQAKTGTQIGIIISDTHGRPFRLGNVGVAIGVAGLPALLDLRGEQDLYGRTLEISITGFADLVASAAHLVCGEGNEGYPVVHIRGLKSDAPHGTAKDIYRPPERDLYR